MATLSIVEHFNILEQVGTCFISGAVTYAVYTFAFESAEEAFEDGLVKSFSLRSKSLFRSLAVRSGNSSLSLTWQATNRRVCLSVKSKSLILRQLSYLGHSKVAIDETKNFLSVVADLTGGDE